MIKLAIIIVIGAVAGVAWLRMQWAVGKNKREAGKIIDSLKNGTYTPESFEESLGMLIRSRVLPENTSIPAFRQNLAALTGKKNVLPEKFTVQYAIMEDNNKGIVVAEGTAKDQLSVGTDQQVTVTYPCWLYIAVNGQQAIFKSSMPDGKDHHCLLEEISDKIFEACTK